MKYIYFIAGLLLIAMPTKAQDTTDVFSRHLKLDEVIISGLTGDSKLSETPSAVSVLDARAIQGSASGNIISAISQEPGVSHISTGSGISKPVIRGMGFNRVVVISDGIRQEGQQWGAEHGVEIDGNAVNSAEIIKGPASLMYGSDALAGVIIFHSDPLPAPGSLTANVSSEYQSNSGLAAYSLHHGGNMNKFNWDIRFSDKYAHSYRNAEDGLVPGTQFRERALSARVGTNRNWGYSRVTLGYYHLTPGMTEGYENGVLEGPTGYGLELPFQHVRHYKLVWDNTILAGSGRIKAILGIQQNRRQEHEESEDEPGLDFKLNTLNYELKYISGTFNGWKVSSGMAGMLQKSSNLAEEVLIPAYRFFDLGLFATATKELERFHFSGGIRGDLRKLHSYALQGRFEDFSRNYTGITGSLGMVYTPLKDLNIRANIARGFRAPNLSELGSNGVHEGTLRYEKGNSDLKPEYSLQGDLGADFATRHIAVTAALFYNSIDNYIFSARSAGQIDGHDIYQYTSGNALLYGGEASVDYHPIHKLHLYAQYSYVRGTSGDDDLPLIPAPRLRGEVKWELFHHGSTFKDGFVAFRVDYHSAQDHFLEGTETATPAYTLLGASAGSDIYLNGRRFATLTLLADNITDAVYSDHLSRLKYAGIREPGRNITVKLEIPIL